MKTSLLMLAVSVLLLGACDRPAEPESAAPAASPAPTAEAPDVPAPAAPAPAAPAQSPAAESVAVAPAAFVDKVWQVSTSSTVAPGTRYTFLGDGTLVIDSDTGTSGYGRWTFDNGALSMIEEGIAYPTDILELDADSFEIRSNNPGGPVTIALVPAVGVPLPAAPAQN